MRWLIQHQLKSKDAATRRKAAEQLCLNPQPGSLRALQFALGNDDPEVRRLAVAALGKIEDERTLEPLLAGLRDRDAGVVKAAIVALKRISDERIPPALEPLLHHADAGVRGYAAQLLQVLGWQPAAREEEIWYLVARGHFSRAASFGASALPALENGLATSPASASVKILEALGGISDPRVGRLLSQALKASDPAICVAAVSVLGRLGGSQALSGLIGMLRHQNSQVRATAVEALGRLREESAVGALGPLLNDPVWEVRRETAEALGRIGDDRAVEVLSGALKDEDADVREASAIALGNLGDRRAIGPLVLALRDSTSGVRRIAAAALSRIDCDWGGSPEARAVVNELKSALQDEDSNVRHFVGQLLVGLGIMEPEAAPGAEVAALSSPAKRRKLAASLFGAMLCDPDRDLRQAAAEALGRLGDDRAKSALLRAQTDEDAGVRAAAEQALETLSR